MTERKYQQGERVKVIAHEAYVSGIKILRESFFGSVIREYSSGKEQYIELDGEGAYPGHRFISKRYVTPVDESTDVNIEYGGEFYIMTCNCGKLRKIKPQHINQVKRCQDCQKEHDKKTARERYKRRRGK